MDYKKAVDRLLSLTDLERVSGQATHVRRYDLSRMEVLVQRLDNPHLGLPTVHITGTKGKGSTAALISSILGAQGYRPGLFTSPHLHSFRERIQYMNEPVTEEEFSSLVEELWPTVERMNREKSYGEVTTFELLTAMAFTHFKRHADAQVVEVGLGGRLDSTNLVKPSVCVITSISLDHTHILGDTVEQIAEDKAGIIKSGSVAVVSPQVPQVMDVIERVCREKEVPLVSVEQECSWTRWASDLDGQSFRLSTSWGEFELWTPLLGGHQLENAATALAALQMMAKGGLSLSLDALDRGFRSVKWPGRLEVLGRAPLLVADGAHNPYSAGRLLEALKECFEFRRLIGVAGVLADKGLEGIAQELAKGLSIAVVTRSRHPRSASPATVAAAFRRVGVEAQEADTTGDALEHALGLANQDDLVVVTGSLFVVAEAREAVLGIPPETYPSLLPGEVHSSKQRG